MGKHDSSDSPPTMLIAGEKYNIRVARVVTLSRRCGWRFMQTGHAAAQLVHLGCAWRCAVHDAAPYTAPCAAQLHAVAEGGRHGSAVVKHRIFEARAVYRYTA
jgi:hypothetical protein